MRSIFFGSVLVLLIACGDDTSTGGGGNGGESQGGSGDGGTTSNGGGGTTSDGGATDGGGGAGQGGTADGGAGGGTGGAGGGACEPITDDSSHIGDNCADAACPAEYTCQPNNGVVFQELCAILCEQDCECPEATVCTPRSDKSNNWMECLGANQ